MTKTHEFILGKHDSSTDFEGHILDVEYVVSSVSDDIKVVDMWRYWDSNNHNHSTPDMDEEMRLPWLSEYFKEKMFEELDILNLVILIWISIVKKILTSMKL